MRPSASGAPALHQAASSPAQALRDAPVHDGGGRWPAHDIRRRRDRHESAVPRAPTEAALPGMLDERAVGGNRDLPGSRSSGSPDWYNGSPNGSGSPLYWLTKNSDWPASFRANGPSTTAP